MASAHEDDPEGGDHAADHAAFDPEPVHTLSPGETPSPLWLPLVGIALFLFGGIYLLVGQDEPNGPDAAPAMTAADAATAAPPEAGPAEAAPRARRPRPPATGQAAGTAAPRMSEDDMRRLKARVEEARKAREAPQAP